MLLSNKLRKCLIKITFVWTICHILISSTGPGMQISPISQLFHKLTHTYASTCTHYTKTNMLHTHVRMQQMHTRALHYTHTHTHTRYTSLHILQHNIYSTHHIHTVHELHTPSQQPVDDVLMETLLWLHTALAHSVLL